MCIRDRDWSGNSSSDDECRGNSTSGCDFVNSDDREMVGLGLMDQLKRLGYRPAGGAMQLMFAGDVLDKCGPNEFAKMEHNADDSMFWTRCEHAVNLGAVEAIEDLKYKYISLCFKSRWQRGIHACDV